MSSIIFGIDPGNTGAVAVIRELENGTVLVHLHDTPTHAVKSGKKLRTVPDPHGMAAILMQYWSETANAHAFIEKVHSMPEQGVASSFNFGMGYGIWQGIMAALAVPYTLVAPETWKKETMPGMGKEKEASLVRAKQIYPQTAPELARKKDVGRSDALLIAHWGRVTQEFRSTMSAAADTRLFTSQG